MKLVYSPTSPFVRKVMVALIETGLRAQVELETVAITPLNPGDVVPDINPLGKVPCLLLDDGSTIFDSRVITRYLDTLHNGTPLYPEGAALWPRLTLEALADGMLEAAVLMVYERVLRNAAQQSPDWTEAQWLKISRALTHLDGLADTLHTVDMASIAVGAALGYLDFRHQDRNWRGLAPKLAAWEAGFSQRPAMLATVPG